MIDRALAEQLAVMRERRAGDVFRFVRYGEMNKAIIALGAVDAIDEIARYFDLAKDAETRMTSLGESSSGRKHPQCARVVRQHDFPNIKKKESSRA